MEVRIYFGYLEGHINKPAADRNGKTVFKNLFFQPLDEKRVLIVSVAIRPGGHRRHHIMLTHFIHVRTAVFMLASAWFC